MGIVQDSEYVAATVKVATGEIDATLEGIDQALGKDAVGMSTPSTADLASFFFKQQAQFPPQRFVYPAKGDATDQPCPSCFGRGVMPNPAQPAETEPCTFCKASGKVGPTVTASPWILALGECENGSDWLSKFHGFVRRNGEQP